MRLSWNRESGNTLNFHGHWNRGWLNSWIWGYPFTETHMALKKSIGFHLWSRPLNLSHYNVGPMKSLSWGPHNSRFTMVYDAYTENIIGDTNKGHLLLFDRPSSGQGLRCQLKSFGTLTQMLHGAGIFTYIWVTFWKMLITIPAPWSI